MKSSDYDFCPVCRQRLSLQIWNNPRVSSTAPIETVSPSSPLTTQTGIWNSFILGTRLPNGPSVANDIIWQLQGPSDPSPVTVAVGATGYFAGIDSPGNYSLTATVTAASNFIKPQKTAGNRDVAGWSLNVVQGPAPDEVSAPGSPQPLEFDALGSTLTWEHGFLNRSTHFALYRGDVSSLRQANYGLCLLSPIGGNSTPLGPESPPTGQAWFFIVTGRTGSLEGPMGLDSAGVLRNNLSPCP